jgi:hypothetical protein
MADIERVTASEVIDEIARKLDPLAFDNPDLADKDRRRELVYMRIDVAVQEYRRRETNYDYNSNEIQDADIPW